MRVIEQAMKCEHIEPLEIHRRGFKRFTLTFVIESESPRVEALIAAVAGSNEAPEKAGHLSIDFRLP